MGSQLETWKQSHDLIQPMGELYSMSGDRVWPIGHREQLFIAVSMSSVLHCVICWHPSYKD